MDTTEQISLHMGRWVDIDHNDILRIYSRGYTRS